MKYFKSINSFNKVISEIYRRKSDVQLMWNHHTIVELWFNSCPRQKSGYLFHYLKHKMLFE